MGTNDEQLNRTMEEVELRLLGYYNTENQKLSDETETPERAAQLAELLAKTFDKVDDPNDDPDFMDAVRNGVFIMRDKEARLYAYFHKDRKARVSGVFYNRDSLVSLPLEYKYWFKPGEKLTIAPMGTANNIAAFQNASFFDYLRQPERVGKQVILATDYLPSKGVISGELVAVGRDFISITDAQGQNFIISNHMCIQLNLPLLQKPKANAPLLQQEVSALGYIKSYNQQKGEGRVVTNDGETLVFSGTSLLDLKLHEGSLVVFSRYPEQEGTFLKDKYGKNLAYANYLHSPGLVDDLLKLAQQLRRQKKPHETTAVLKHILDEYPNHVDANAMIQELSGKVESQGKQQEQDSDTVEFNKANEIINNGGNKIEAIQIYEDLLARGKKVKDCIMRITTSYQALYEETEEEDEKDSYRISLLDHIDKYHDKLTPSASMNMQLQSYMKLRDDERYYGLINKELVETEQNPDNPKRGRMLYFKALYMSQSELAVDKEQASEYAEESLFLTPFNNKAELLWEPAKQFINDTPSVPKGRSSYAQALLRKGSVKDDNNTVDWMELLNKANKYGVLEYKNAEQMEPTVRTDYAELLLGAATSGKAVNKANQDVTDLLLAEYMSYKARELAVKGKLDSAIYLWNELFTIVQGMGYFVQVNLASMLAAVLRKGIVDNTTSVYTPWQDILADSKDINSQQWEQILYAVSTNTEVLNTVEQFVMDNAQLAAKWEMFTNTTGYEGTMQEVVADMPRKSFEESAASLLAELHKNVPELTDKLIALSAADFSRTPFVQLSSTEQKWLGNLTENCRPLANQYMLMDNVKERLKKGEEIKTKLNALAEAVMQQPTWLGVNGLLPLINSINANIDRVADASTDYFKPQITLTITSEYVSKMDDGFYHIAGQIYNAGDAGDASNLRLTIKSKKNFAVVKASTTYLGLVKGGMNKDFFFDVKIKSETETKGICGFSVTCEYSYKDQDYNQQFNPLQVNLGQAPSFNKIEKQPYNYGQAIRMSDPSFVGRSKDIKEISDFVMNPQLTGPQIIVYGQKRCGKSTLVGAVKTNLEEYYPDKAFCVYFTLSPESNDDSGVWTEADFYWTLLYNIRLALRSNNEEEKPTLVIPTKEELENSDIPSVLFSEAIIAFKHSMANTPGWEQRRLVVIIDEFTRLYTCIKEGLVPENILHKWKAIQESASQANFATIFVGHDITPKFFDEEYARNTTSIITQKQISYIDEKSARELVEKPIWDDIYNQSRFKKDAVDRIIYYTACNPSYLQIFMMHMVEYINANERVKVTRLDVEEVANAFITKQYPEFANIGKFDNLINSGIKDEYTDFTDHQFEIVLRIIARLTKDTPYCQRIAVEKEVWDLKPTEENKKIMECLDDILYDLDTRRVIERKENSQQIKIIIALFKEWLIRN